MVSPNATWKLHQTRERRMNTNTMSEISKSHLEVLVELLSSIDMGKRTETLIDAQSLLTEPEAVEMKFKSIRKDLEEELMLIRQMIFMVNKAEELIDECEVAS